MADIGIDLGTSYSCVGVREDDGVEIISNEIGSRKTPSYVSFTEMQRLIGDAAKNQATMNPINTVFDMRAPYNYNVDAVYIHNFKRLVSQQEREIAMDPMNCILSLLMKEGIGLTAEQINQKCDVDLNNNKTLLHRLKNHHEVKYKRENKCFSYNYEFMHAYDQFWDDITKEDNTEPDTEVSNYSAEGGSTHFKSFSYPFLENAVKTYLLRAPSVTTSHLFSIFIPKLKTSEEKQTFIEIVKKTTRIKKTSTNIWDSLIKLV